MARTRSSRKSPRPPRRGKKKRASKASKPAAPQAVAYVRVSSKDQEREGFSIPAQQKLLHQYATEQGFAVVSEFIDVETAKRAGRTEFVRMVSFLRKRAPSCRVILVEKTDRLYRNFKDWVSLDDMDLEIHLVKEGTIISRDARSSEKFIHGIKVLMAKNYIDNLSEEASKGMREKAEQGLWPSFAPLGYRNVLGDNGKRIIEPDPERATLITRLFELAATGRYSLRDLTSMMQDEGLTTRKRRQPVNAATIHAILHKRIYTGDFEWNGELYHGVHAPLVPLGMWEKVQEVLSGRYQGQATKSRKELFAYSGLIKCGHCGCSLVAELKKGKYVYYHCTGQRGKCPEKKYVREERLTEQFAAALDALVMDDEVVAWVAQGLRESLADEQEFHRQAVERLQASYTRIQERLDAMYADKLDGRIDAATFDRLACDWRDE